MVSAGGVSDRPAAFAGVTASTGAVTSDALTAIQKACLEALEQGVVLFGLDGTVHMANSAAARILRTDPQDFASRIIDGTLVVRDEDGVLLAQEHRPIVHTVLTGEPVADQMVLVDLDDGAQVALRVTTEAVNGADGRMEGMAVAFADVSRERALTKARREADEEVRASQARLEALLEKSADLICVTDLDGVVRYASPAARNVMGDDLPEGQAIDWDIVHPDDVAKVREAIDELLAAPGAIGRAEVRIRVETGWRHVEVVATNRLHDPAVQGIVANVRDITERAVAAAQLSWQAFHDSLTGLPNRGLMLDRIKQALERSRRRGDRVALLFVDLDRFKHINDERGHDVGDKLLVESAARLAYTVRSGDTVARLGGDEFVVVAEGGDETDIGRLADRIRAALEAPAVIDGLTLSVSASIGVAFDTGRPAERLLRDADAALYRAKQRGRNRVEVFNEALRVAAQRRAQVESTLRRVIDDGQLVVHHQPIVDLRDGLVMGTEALVRVPVDRDRLEPPGEYLAVAEDRGLIIPLGEAVLDAACRELASHHQAMKEDGRWVDGEPRPFVAVNVSARQLAASTFPSRLCATLDRHGIRPHDLVLEITEDTVIGADRSTGRAVASLHEMGVRLWLDDFGTGYSSLGYIKRFPIDAIKLDRSFVSGLGHERSDTEIVRAVLALGEALDLAVVAEGVETGRQLCMLRNMGCRWAQGFALGAPVLGAEVDAGRRDLDRLSILA